MLRISFRHRSDASRSSRKLDVPRGLEGIQGAWEPAVRVKTARVVAMDRQAILADFAELAALSNQELEAWLISQAGYIGYDQAAQCEVNEPIACELKDQKNAFRPVNYGRALVLSTEGASIDVKGAGSPHPRQGSHSNGLATLAECLREFTWHQIVGDVLHHAGSEVSVLPAYGVIDWGFCERGENGEDGPRVGALLRRAHRRNEKDQGVWPTAQAEPVERTLRTYGLTTAGDFREKFDLDLVDIQGTQEGRQIFDLSTVLAFNPMPERPVVNLADRWLSPKRWKAPHDFEYAPHLMEPGKDFPQPDPKLAVPVGLLGGYQSDDRLDLPGRVWNARVEEYVSGKASPDDLARVVTEFRNPVRERLGQKPIDWHDSAEG